MAAEQQRFVSKIPVRSDSSKGTLLKVKKVKSLIEGNEATLAVLMKEKLECNQKIVAATSAGTSCASLLNISRQSSTTSKSRIPIPSKLERSAPVTLRSSNTRTLIRTPGGTKRKGM